METTVNDYRNSGITGYNSSSLMASVQTKAVAETEELSMESPHKGRSISYFLNVYVVIFTSIMVIVMIEEYFFIK